MTWIEIQNKIMKIQKNNELGMFQSNFQTVFDFY